MERAKPGDTVKVHYTGTLEDGEVFDSSVERGPLEFTIGSGNLIPGFEVAVVGMSPGESKTETIPPEQAYGARRDELQGEVDRAQLPPNLDLEVGKVLGVKGADGEVTRVRISELTDAKVMLDANHPLAGHNLTFKIELLEIQAA